MTLDNVCTSFLSSHCTNIWWQFNGMIFINYYATHIKLSNGFQSVKTEVSDNHVHRQVRRVLHTRTFIIYRTCCRQPDRIAKLICTVETYLECWIISSNNVIPKDTTIVFLKCSIILNDIKNSFLFAIPQWGTPRGRDMGFYDDLLVLRCS